MTSQLNGGLHFLCFFFIPFILKIIVACRLHVIYVREDNDSMGAYTAYMDYMGLIRYLRKAVELNHSLTHSLAQHIPRMISAC